MSVLWLVFACTGGEPVDTGEPWDQPEGGEISLVTRDEVSLGADYYPAGHANRPAVVLLHMVPPSFDRTSWPIEFIELLQANDWSVVALDRRGAGDSEGVAVDAYEGEFGRYDVEAVTLMLDEDRAGELILIGASNGTTSLADYAAWAGTEGAEDLMQPSALGFLSGGPYTENQTPFGDVPVLPSFFSYENSDREKTWAEEREAAPEEPWEFWYYDPGAHGTQMFGYDAEFGGRVNDFLVAAVDG